MLIALSFAVLSASSQAQKLPNKQDVSLRPSDKVKIDGKISEWGKDFKAYNHATNLFYSIANDEANLYLVIRAADQLTVRKIIAGSITFSINAINKRKVMKVWQLLFRFRMLKIN